MKKKFKIFVINPGSTSTKIGMFENNTQVFSKNITHDADKLNEFKEISDQFGFREDEILRELEANKISLEGTDAFVGRGGGLVSMIGGTYIVNDTLYEHARVGFTAKHPATLGSQLARHFSAIYGGQAFVVNPPDVDEFVPEARVTGLVDVARESKIHALNQKEIGKRYAQEIGSSYNEVNLIIAHIGGGISVTAHRKGLMIDSNDIINGDGPMAPTRSGSLPAAAVIKLCYSGKYSETEMYNRITKTGGLVDHLGISDTREVIKRIKGGDEYAKLVYDSMIYQIGKNIGSFSASLKGDVDAILLTGGIANDSYLVEKLTEMVNFIAPVKVYAGEFEMEALAGGALSVLEGREEAKVYNGKPVWNGFGYMLNKK